MTTSVDRYSRVDLWGPPCAGKTQGAATAAPRKHHGWGLLDLVWVVLALVGTQVALFAVFALVAIARGDIQTDASGGGTQVGERVTEMFTSGPGLVSAVLSQWAVFVGVPLYASYRKGHRSLAKDFGLWFKRNDPVHGLGIAVGLQALMYALTWLLHQTPLDLSDAENTSQVTDHRGALLIFMIFGAAVMAPVVEELLFRGLMMRGMLRRFAGTDHAPLLAGVTDRFHDTAPQSALRKRVGVGAAVLLSSIIFGLAHMQSLALGSWVVAAQTGLLGLVFAVVAYKTRRLGTTICAHFFFNSISLALVLALPLF